MAPRAPGDSVRPRRLSAVVVRPLNFTVRRTMSRKAPQFCPTKHASLLVTAAAAALAAGCSIGWVRPNASPEQIRNDNAECQVSAAGKYPPIIIRAGSLRPGEPSIDTDSNELLRNEEAKYCMRQKGYTYARVR